jgi:hypothetical protein
MTLITLQGGKLVLRDGKVGTEQACCCDAECVCPESCLENLRITFGESGEGANCVTSFDGTPLYSDRLIVAGGYSLFVFMSCIDGQWGARVSRCDPLCAFSGTIDLECDADSLPVARQITDSDWNLTVFFGDCRPVPTVEIVK